jgi:putative transposase
MNPPKCDEFDYIQFLIATQKAYSCTEAARVQPEGGKQPAHDAVTRLLHRLEPDPEALWVEAQPYVAREQGMLIVDDSTLDKLHAHKIDLVTRHWSGRHQRVVHGINLITLLWTEGESHIPCDYRVYAKNSDGLTKNDHLRQMLAVAHGRGFRPECVAFDSWYGSTENLKAIAGYGWRWLTQLKTNRLVNPDRTGNRPVSEVAIDARGTIVHLKDYGMIKVFKIVARDGDIEYWATNDLTMDELTRLKYAEQVWMIEDYHRGIKQFCGIDRAQARSACAQRNHFQLALRAFLRLEHHRMLTGISWFEAKTDIIRHAVRAYLAHPLYTLGPTA